MHAPGIYGIEQRFLLEIRIGVVNVCDHAPILGGRWPENIRWLHRGKGFSELHVIFAAVRR